MVLQLTVADVMTKPLDHQQHWAHLVRMGMAFLEIEGYLIEIDEDEEADDEAEDYQYIVEAD